MNNRLRTEKLENGIIRVFDFATKQYACYVVLNGQLVHHSGPNHASYREAAQGAL